MELEPVVLVAFMVPLVRNISFFMYIKVHTGPSFMQKVSIGIFHFLHSLKIARSLRIRGWKL
jgi:hypothetical protein